MFTHNPSRRAQSLRLGTRTTTLVTPDPAEALEKDTKPKRPTTGAPFARGRSGRIPSTPRCVFSTFPVPQRTCRAQLHRHGLQRILCSAAAPVLPARRRDRGLHGQRVEHAGAGQHVRCRLRGHLQRHVRDPDAHAAQCQQRRCVHHDVVCAVWLHPLVLRGLLCLQLQAHGRHAGSVRPAVEGVRPQRLALSYPGRLRLVHGDRHCCMYLLFLLGKVTD
jgi:hypothetical protein